VQACLLQTRITGKEGGRKMLTMAQVHSVRQLFFEKGLGHAEIARTTGCDVKTMKKYIHMKDSTQPLLRLREIRCSKLDEHKEHIADRAVGNLQASGNLATAQPHLVIKP
jgi:hypothetical protein